MRALRWLLTVAGIALLVFYLAGCIAYAGLNRSNLARPEALAALESDANVTVTQPPNTDWFVFEPTGITPKTGLIIYPGGFVDPRAYALLARDIAAQGYLVVIDAMPLNLAVTDFDSANAIIAAYPTIDNWAVGGHSLGGAMAAEYAAGNSDEVEGLALWAAYPAASTDLSSLPLQVVSLYGDRDGLASVEEVLDGGNRLPDSTVFVLIEGANHTQFGAYGDGLQRGDNPAGISAEDQRAEVARRTVDMLRRLENGG